MVMTRSVEDHNRITDWTEEVNEVENQFGFVREMNYFNERSTSQTSIVFDVNAHTITLLPQLNRNSREKTYGKDRRVTTHALPLFYYNHGDNITPEDVQGWRMPGLPNSGETLDNVRMEKFMDMRLAADQTDEYLKIQALKGISMSPDGTTQANMYTLLGITPTSVDFELGTPSTDIDAKIAEVKRHITSNTKTGGAIAGIDVLVDDSWFDKFIAHPRIREVYNQYQNSGVQQLRDDLSTYYSWGVTDMFMHRGVRFISYSPEFNLPQGGTERAFDTDQGIAFPTGVRDLFRGYYGPANTLSGANNMGQPMFMTEFRDPKDKFIDLELEMTKLYFCTKPAAVVQVTTSN